MIRKSLTSFFAVFSLALATAVFSAPEADLWRTWLRHADSSSFRVDHSAWQNILDRYVTTDREGIARFNYGEVTEESRRTLEMYLDQLQKIDVSGLVRVQQLAYWINLYNALTVHVVLNHYPVESIRDIDISPGLFSDGPWGKKLLEIDGQPVSLNDIEHRILRPIWGDPRIHYAVNCASISCPNLQREAFTAENMESQLERAAATYVNHPRGVAFEEGELVVSSIYHWFGSDFGGTDQKIIEHIKHYAKPHLANRLSKIDRISGHRYDWTLNAP